MTTYLIAFYLLGVLADLIESRHRRLFPVPWRAALLLAPFWPLTLMANLLRKANS